MQLDQSLLNHWIRVLLEILLKRGCNAAHQRTVQSSQELLEFPVRWLTMKLAAQAHMEKLLPKLMQKTERGRSAEVWKASLNTRAKGGITIMSPWQPARLC